MFENLLLLSNILFSIEEEGNEEQDSSMCINSDIGASED